MALTTRQYVLYGTYAVLTITSVVLFAVSFAVLSPNWVGLEYNKNSRTVNFNKLYSSGRYLLGVGHTFIAFPTTTQTVLFAKGSGHGSSLAGRTSDGLAIQMDITFQYKLYPILDSLVDLYQTHGTNYRDAYIAIARSELYDVASEFTAFAAIQEREAMGAAMLERLDTRLQLEHAEVVNLQLLDLNLPAAFNEAIRKTVVAQQDVERAQFQQNTADISARTDVLTAAVDAEIIVVEANASAMAVGLEGAAEAEALTTRIDAEAETYAAVQTVLQNELGASNFTTSDLLTYVWLQSLEVSNTGAVVLDVDLPKVLRP